MQEGGRRKDDAGRMKEEDRRKEKGEKDKSHNPNLKGGEMGKCLKMSPVRKPNTEYPVAHIQSTGPPM